MLKHLMYGIGLAVVFGASFAVADLASADPGFEQGTKYWYLMKPVSYSSFAGDGIGGSRALEIVNNSAKTVRKAGAYRKNYVEVREGELYTFRVSFKGRLTEGQALAMLNFFRSKEDGRHQYRGTVNTAKIHDSGGGWKRLHCTFRIPKGTDLLHFGFKAENFRGRILFDDVSLVPGDGAMDLPLLPEAPSMEGKPDRDFAARTLQLYDFMAYPLSGDQAAPEKTEVWLGQTPDVLHGVVLLHHDPGRTLKKDCVLRDGPVWNDDSVEFFITQTNAPRPYYHFILNTRGIIFDSLENNKRWNSNMQARGGRLDDSCDFIQFRLPLKDIGYDAELDAHLSRISWKINVTRSHHLVLPGGRKQTVYSTFAKVSSFHNPLNFVPMAGLTGGQGQKVSARYWNRDGMSSGKGNQSLRHWRIEKPAYRELLSGTPNPLKGESAFIWGRPIDRRSNTDFAIQYGRQYTLDMMLQEYRKHRLHPYSTDQLDQLDDWGRQSGIGFVLYSPYYMDQCGFLYDQKIRRKYLDRLKEILDRHHQGMWGVAFGDEVMSQSLSRFIGRANDRKELKKDPALLKALETIREQYGSGRHGVPRGIRSEEPFSWIAVRRWALDEMLKTQKEIHHLCSRYTGVGGRPLKVISSDHVDWGFMQQQSRFAEYQDIVTSQILPSNDPNRQTVAFRAKLLRDLTGNSVWLCLHVEPYAGCYTSEETAAFISEAVRGGCTGLQIWNYDYLADLRKMGSSQFDYYGHRPRWNTIMDCLARMREDNLPQYPEADFAVLVSNDTAFARPKMKVHHYESAFNLMGPGAGAWFRFVSDTQLLDSGSPLLHRWKLLVIPKADILSAELAGRLENYLKQGGTVLCLDPDFMNYDVSGKNISRVREKLFGARTVPARNCEAVRLKGGIFPPELTGGSFCTTGAAAELVPLGDTEILAVYASSGRPAVTCRRYPGGGRAILSAFEVQPYFSADLQWRKLTREILNQLGAGTDRNIWNFLYPHTKEREPFFDSECLTGNHFYWWNNEVRAKANVILPQAFYTYDLAPDQEDRLRYHFSEGRLTNRLKAPLEGDLANRKRNRHLIQSGRLHRGLFADSWSRTDPLEIKFDFGEKVIVEKAVVFWNGELPDRTQIAGDDGKRYLMKGGKTDGVLKSETRLPGIQTRKLVFSVPPRKPGEKLLLSEIEIWGRKE